MLKQNKNILLGISSVLIKTFLFQYFVECQSEEKNFDSSANINSQENTFSKRDIVYIVLLLAILVILLAHYYYNNENIGADLELIRSEIERNTLETQNLDQKLDSLMLILKKNQGQLINHTEVSWSSIFRLGIELKGNVTSIETLLRRIQKYPGSFIDGDE